MNESKSNSGKNQIGMPDLNPVLSSIGILPELKDYCKQRSLVQLIDYPLSYIFLGFVGPEPSLAYDPKIIEKWEHRITAAFASASMGFSEAEKFLALPIQSPKTFCLVSNGSADGASGIASRVARSLANWRILAIKDTELTTKLFPVQHTVPTSHEAWKETFLRHVDIVLCLDTDMDTGPVPKFTI